MAIITALALLASPETVPGSPEKTCAVLQSAFMTASDVRTGKTYDGKFYPKVIHASAEQLNLKGFHAEYRSRMALSPAEFAELSQREAADEGSSFQPNCRWPGKPTVIRNHADGYGYVSFTKPVFSRLGDLALVQVSIYETYRFGHGDLCVVRHSRGRWTAKCQPSWIS